MRKLILIILVATVTGCMSMQAKHGKRFSYEDVKKIKRCVTTENEVINNFGEPIKVGIQSRYKTLNWSYSDFTMSPFQSNEEFIEKASKNSGTLIIFINDEEIVVDYAFNPQGLVQVVDNCK